MMLAEIITLDGGGNLVAACPHGCGGVLKTADPDEPVTACPNCARAVADDVDDSGALIVVAVQTEADKRYQAGGRAP